MTPPEPAVPTRRDDVVDTIHGVTLVDPYRWLEESESDEVRSWSAAQTERTQRILEQRPGYGEIAARAQELLRIGAVEPPAVVGSRTGRPRYFYRRQGPSQNHPVLYLREGAGSGPSRAGSSSEALDRVLLDPNALDPDGLTSLDWWSPSPDGRLLAYGLSQGGDEESTLHVLDVATGRELGSPDVIPRARYASIAWLPDGSGFYYSRYPAKGEFPPGEERYHRRLFLHLVGQDHERDALVFGDGRAMTDIPSIDISPDGRWLVVSVHMGWSRREAYLMDRSAGPAAPWIPLAVPDEDAVFDVATYNDHLLVRTNEGAPNYRVFRVDPERPERAAWREILPEGKDVLATVTEISGALFVTFIEDARSAVRRYGPDGALQAEIPLPAMGLVNGVTGEWDGGEAFFDFTSFAIPAQVWRIDVATGQVSLWAEVKPPIDPAEFVVEQIKVPSKDGTPIPTFIVYKRGTPRDGTAPALLSGYGGFNISMLPQWSGTRYLLLERGGITVNPNLRGGGEYGEAWHRAGMLEKKQNVFDDFFAVAEHLLRERFTSPDRLAIAGGSNGGLLIGAAVTQRPELFRAAVCSVPLLDMLRYDRFLIAKLWIPEYGSAEDPEQFGWLRAYSPYHRFDPGARYPSVLFSAAEGDSRVDPLHARKMAALMQAHESPDRPILLRVEGKAGHGAGKPITKRIDEAAALWSFLFWQLGLE